MEKFSQGSWGTAGHCGTPVGDFGTLKPRQEQGRQDYLVSEVPAGATHQQYTLNTGHSRDSSVGMILRQE